MAKYKDRFGEPIREGDVVLSAITINFDTYKGFAFSTNIVKKRGQSLILDGVYCTSSLSQRKRRELVKVTPDTDLRSVEVLFLRDRQKAARA